MLVGRGEDVSTGIGGEGRRCEYRCWWGEDVSTGVGGEGRRCEYRCW